MKYKGEKERFCAGNKCGIVFFVLTLVAIVIVVCVTLLSEDVRSPAEPDEEKQPLKWWQKAIVYQIYPRSFQDSNGDGTGDIKGIISRLPYLQDLGIGAVWLSPFYKSPMKDFGYDISDYRQVDPLFGTMDDFNEMIKVTHDLGLKFIVDFVPNHCSDQHDWFQLSRNKTGKYANYFIWKDPKTLPNGTKVEPNNWQSVFTGPAWQWDNLRKQYYYHAFLKSQPDLNYHNEDVKKEMDEILKFWLNKGVDGFRIDAIPHLFERSNLSHEVQPNDADQIGYRFTKNQPEIYAVVHRWREVLDKYEEKDGKVRWLLAETFDIPESSRQKYYQAGSTPFDFDLITVKDICHNNVDAKCIRGIIKKGVNLTGDEWPNFVTGNHDNGRISDRFGPEFVDAMNMLLLTLPGTPTTYYGEEIGMKNGNYTGMPPKDTFAIRSNNTADSRDPERNPMQWNNSVNAGFSSGTPWLPVTDNSDFENINVKVESMYENSTLGFYKNLARLRQNTAFLNAKIEFASDDDNILAYIRSNGSKQFLIVIHFGQNPVTVSLSTGHQSGFVVAATGKIFDRLHKVIDTQNIPLERGDGLVILLR